MVSFSVLPAELRGAARMLREEVQEFAARSTLKYRLNANEVGNEDLAGALAEFQANSAKAITALQEDATELAERLGDSADGYEEIDSELAQTLAGMLDQR